MLVDADIMAVVDVVAVYTALTSTLHSILLQYNLIICSFRRQRHEIWGTLCSA